MNREEAINRIQAMVYYMDSLNANEGEQKDIEAYRMAIKALEQTTWIPVSERLPEKNVWVLVTVNQNGNCHQEIMRRNKYIEAWTDNIDNYTDEITAWMPLPEPYEEREERE